MWVGFNVFIEVINLWWFFLMFCVFWNYNVKFFCGCDCCFCVDIGFDKVLEWFIFCFLLKLILGGVGWVGLWFLFWWSGGRVCGLLLYLNILLLFEKFELILILLCCVGGGEVERLELFVYELELLKLDVLFVSFFFFFRLYLIFFWML